MLPHVNQHSSSKKAGTKSAGDQAKTGVFFHLSRLSDLGHVRAPPSARVLVFAGNVACSAPPAHPCHENGADLQEVALLPRKHHGCWLVRYVSLSDTRDYCIRGGGIYGCVGNFRASGSVRRHCPLPFLLLPLFLVSLVCSVVLSPSRCSHPPHPPKPLSPQSPSLVCMHACT